MKRFALLLYIGLFISTGSLIIGFSLSGLWLIVLLVILLFLGFGLTRKYQADWSAPLVLFSSVFLSAIGVVVDLPLILMLVACVAGLVSWDLLQFMENGNGNFLAGGTVLLERDHLRTLGVAVAAGVFLSLISSVVQIHVPFIAVAFLALLAVFCLSYGLHLISGD